MDNVTLGAVAVGISVLAFLLVNVLSLQAVLQRKRDEREPAWDSDSTHQPLASAAGASSSGSRHSYTDSVNQTEGQPRKRASM